MGLQRRWQMVLGAIFGGGAVLLGSSAAVHADGGNAEPGQVIVIAGDGATLTISSTGYTDCASQDVSVFLVFPQRKDEPSPPGSPYRFLVETPTDAPRFSETTVHVDADGRFEASLLLPEITPARWHGYAVMAGDCDPSGYRVLTDVFYAAPATATAFADLQTGIGALPAGASAIVIPSLAIDSVAGANDDISGNYLLDHLTAYANDERCAALNLKPADARDAAGDAVLVIGTGDEPAACRQRGAELTFTAWPEDVLLDFRTTLLPGTVQPIALITFGPDNPPTRDNMPPSATVIDTTSQTRPPADASPPAAIGSGQGLQSATLGADSPTPAAPVNGTGVARTTTADWPMVAGVILLAFSIAVFGLTWKGRAH